MGRINFVLLPSYFVWGSKDSNLGSHKTTDLQSVPVGRFGIPPSKSLRTNEKPPDVIQEAFLKRECKIIRFSTFSKLISTFSQILI